jgi:hypothetical protein
MMILALPVLVTGCEFQKPRICPDPGGITNSNCIYELTISRPSPGADLAIGKTPENIVVANSKRRMWGNVIADFDPKDYPYFEYVFHTKDANGLAVNNTYTFVNEPGEYYLKLCDIECNVKRIKNLYPDRSDDEIRQCVAEDKCWWGVGY